MVAELPVAAAPVGRRPTWLIVVGFAFFCLIFGLLVAFYPVPGLVALGALVLAVFLCFRPELALPLALFTVPLDLLGHVTPDGSITVAKLLILLAILIWVARSLLLKDRYPLGVFSHPVSLLMFAFLAVNVLSLTNAIALDLAASYLGRRLNVVVFALLIAVVLRDRRAWDRALVWMTLASIPIAFFGLYELVTGQPILALVAYRSQDELQLLSGEYWRIHGTFDDAPFHAIYVVTAMSLSLCWLLRTRNRWLQAGLVALLLLLVINLVGTGSRGGALGLAAVLVVFWTGLGMRQKRILLAGLAGAGAVVLLLALFLPQIPLHRYLRAGTEEDPTTEIRAGLYPVAFEMIADHPFIGVGTGNWMRHYHRYSAAGTFKDVRYQPANTYLQICAENGVVGLAVYLLLLGIVAYHFRLALRGAVDREERIAVLASLGAFLAFAAFALTSNVMENETYWIFIGFSIVASRLPSSHSGVPAGDA